MCVLKKLSTYPHVRVKCMFVVGVFLHYIVVVITVVLFARVVLALSIGFYLLG